MLAIAQQRCELHFSSLPPDGRAKAWSLEEVDIFSAADEPGGAELLLPKLGSCQADLVVSTLVLEHIPLSTFFKVAAKLVKPGGTLLVTNMHGEMGEVSQAGFVDTHGVKVRPQSFAHGVLETVEEAGKCKFVLVGDLLERSVEEGDVAMLGQRARKWVRGPKVWFGGVWRKESGSNDGRLSEE